MRELRGVVNRLRVFERGFAVLAVTLTVYGFCAGPALGKPFYEGKTLRILVPFFPGGTSDIFSRLLARFMPGYIPGKPTIIVQNMPGGGGIIAMNYLYAIAKPDGLTIAHTSVPGARDQLLSVPGVKFDFAKFEYLGSGGPSFQLFAVRRNLGFETLEDLKKATKTIFVSAGGKGSTPSVVSEILAREGYNIQPVHGHAGSAPRSAAVIKGEVDGTTFESPDALQQKEHITPLFWIASKDPEWADFPNLEELSLSPTTRSFIRAVTVPVSLARTFLALPHTPKERVQMLAKAFEQTVKSSAFLKQAKKINLPVLWLSPEETKALSLEVLNTPPQRAAALKKIMGLSE